MRSVRPTSGLCLVAFSALLGFAVVAEARPSTPDDVLFVANQPFIDNATDDTGAGILTGSIVLHPGIQLQTVYDDNVLLTKDNKKSDLITDVKPALAILSNWDRHAIAFGAEGDFGYYKKETDENYTDYGLMASGRYDLDYNTYLTGGLTQKREHEGRDVLDDPNGGGRVTYLVTAEQLGFVRELGRIHLNVTGLNEHVNLSSEQANAAALGGSDRDDQNLQTTLSYEYMPGNDVFTTLEYDRAEYDLAGGGRRVSNGTNLRAGMHIDPARSVKGSFYAGYLFQDYEGGDSSTSDPYFGGTIDWAITPLTTVSLTLDKTFNQTTVQNAAGVVHTTRQVRISHSFSDRLTSDATLGVDNNKYVGGTNSSNGNSKLYYGDLYGNYDLVKDVKLRLGYNYGRRTSSLPNDEYTDNRVLLSLVWMR